MQQFSFIDLFIDLFKSALHVSGDKFAHLQEHYWLYIQLWYNTPILLPTGDKVFTGRQQYRCIVPKAVYTIKKCSWEWASLSPETCRADSNRSIQRSINGICCIFLVAYIVVLMTHVLTNVKFITCLWLVLINFVFPWRMFTQSAA